jgi:prepilin-type N-terminal cleavage/methylation domain-containing protein
MRTTERGFSLVEVIISTALVAGAIATLAHLLTVCAGTNAIAHHLTKATVYAQQKLEQLRSGPALNDAPRQVEYLDADGTTQRRRLRRRGTAERVGSTVRPAPAAVFVHVASVQPRRLPATFISLQCAANTVTR